MKKIAARMNFEGNPFQIRAALFHCTPVSERRRRPQWDYDDGYQRGNSRNRTSRRRGFEFFYDSDDDFETIFCSMFCGNGYSFSAGTSNPRYRNSYANYRPSSCWKYEDWKYEEWKYEDDNFTPQTEDTTRSDRLTLGLSPSGPLNLKDVKNAYRECALKWHPDRHHGSTKGVAEEKFKVCNAAYESLCDKLPLRY